QYRALTENCDRYRARSGPPQLRALSGHGQSTAGWELAGLLPRPTDRHCRRHWQPQTARAQGDQPPALSPRTPPSSAAGRNLSKMKSAVFPKSPTVSGKVKNPACGLVDNTARLRILTSRQFPHRPDIITDLLRADIFKNLQHPRERGRGG